MTINQHFWSSTIRLALLLNFSSAKHAVIRFILSDMTTRLFHEKSMNAMLRKFSPLRSAFRVEVKRMTQIFKLSKHVSRSTSSHANPTDLAE